MANTLNALKFKSLYSKELVKFGAIYIFLALINLRVKLNLTPAWFNGNLERNHNLLLAFQYTNNEQSRLLQYYIPETLRRVFGLSINNAYIFQRWAFIFLAFICFHFYLKKWFDTKLSFVGVAFLAAIMPLSYFNHLQESAPLLLLTFLLALWAIREHKLFWYMVILFIGALNNETMLVLPLVYFCYNIEKFEFRHLWRLSVITLGSCLPAYAAAGIIRYITRDVPRLEKVWQLPDNIQGVIEHIRFTPLEYWDAEFLYFVFLFGAFWVFSFLAFSDKPLFLKRAAIMLPIFVIIHFMVSIIKEVRLLLPLSFIIIPMALFSLFPLQQNSESDLK
jgi:hypothetical protein